MIKFKILLAKISNKIYKIPHIQPTIKMKDTKENQQFCSNNSAKILKREDYIHIPIYKDGNCFFRSISVYLTDTQDNYKIIRELIAEYAEVNKETFIEFFIKGNVDQALGSMDLNNYIQNIKNDGQFAGIIELSIASKLFDINIFIYKEGPSDSDNYILYEKIDNDDLTLPKCNLLFENENHFSLLIKNNANNIKRIISTPTEIKNKINKSTINITKNLLDKSKKFEINKYVILKKGKYYYDNIYHFLMSEKIAKKMNKNAKNLYVETYDWKKLVYPADLYGEDDDNKKK